MLAFLFEVKINFGIHQNSIVIVNFKTLNLFFLFFSVCPQLSLMCITNLAGLTFDFTQDICSTI